MIKIGGWSPFSSVDYPGRLSATVFMTGCPWNCSYCHNDELRSGPGRHDWDFILDSIRRRASLLDAVVFSGGEPTIQKGLGAAIRDVRAAGEFQVGLHTAGAYPDALGELLAYEDTRPDWVGLDIKAPAGSYAKVTGQYGSGLLAWESLRILLERYEASELALEVRTTLPEDWDVDSYLAPLASTLHSWGVPVYAVQVPHGERGLSQDELDWLNDLFQRFIYRAG